MCTMSKSFLKQNEYCYCCYGNREKNTRAENPQDQSSGDVIHFRMLKRYRWFDFILIFIFVICAKTITMESAQSEGKPDTRGKMSKGGEETLQDTSQEKKQLENLKSDELKDLKSEVQTVSETSTLLTMEGALLEAHAKAKQLEADLESERAEVRKLREKLAETEREAKNTLESTQASHQLQTEKLKEETRKIAAALTETEDLLETERFCRQQENIFHLEEKEKAKALHELQLDEEKCNIDTLADALMSLTQKFEDCQYEWYVEKSSLVQTTEDLKKTVQDMQQEAKEAMERSQASHQAALKEAEDLLETERLSWQQEKISLLEIEKYRAHFEDQLEEQDHENKTLADALWDVQRKLERHQLEWQEEKTSLIQTTESLRKTLWEWEEEERSMKSRLEDLKRKKNRKWYRRIFGLA